MAERDNISMQASRRVLYATNIFLTNGTITEPNCKLVSTVICAQQCIIPKANTQTHSKFIGETKTARRWPQILRKFIVSGTVIFRIAVTCILQYRTHYQIWGLYSLP